MKRIIGALAFLLFLALAYTLEARMGEGLQILINVGVWLLVIITVLVYVIVADRKARKELQDLEDAPLGIESSHAHRFTDEKE